MVKIFGRFLYHCHLNPPKKRNALTNFEELPDVRPEVRPDPMQRVPAYEAWKRTTDPTFPTEKKHLGDRAVSDEHEKWIL